MKKDIKVADVRMIGILALYDLHTDYFIRALDGISDKDAHNRMNTKANHVAWIAGSTVQQRFELATSMGLDLKSANHELFKEGKGIQDDLAYPSLDIYREEWKKISPVAREILTNISQPKLDEMFPIPEMQMTYFELITFMGYREANCIGQIALYRRLLGYKALNYM